MSDPELETVLKVESPSDPDVKKAVALKREDTRARIVFWLLFTMLFIFAAPLVASLICPQAANDKIISISEKLLTGLIGLLGTAIAFFFRNE